MELVKEALDKYEYIKVIGIAGPGEPLANEETFETLRRLDEQYPNVIKCLRYKRTIAPR